MKPRPIPAQSTAGFSIIELLMVAAIIAIMAAVAIPNIARYFRNYQISSAVREVSGEIQGARNKAVLKNVNFGTVFYIRSATTYRVAIEDDQNPAGTPPRTPRALRLEEAEADPDHQATPLRRLPGDVTFGTGCAGGTFAPNDIGIRFTRLGTSCVPGTTQCTPDLINPPGLTTNFVMNSATGTSICLVQPSTGLRRLIRISPGGRVMSREGQG